MMSRAFQYSKTEARGGKRLRVLVGYEHLYLTLVPGMKAAVVGAVRYKNMFHGILVIAQTEAGLLSILCLVETLHLFQAPNGSVHWDTLSTQSG